MRRMRLSLLLISLCGFVACVVLLLNITAPNPTHRRYSSWMPRSGKPANSQEIGLDGELALSRDLGLPRNSIAGQQQDICRSKTVVPTEGGRCAAYYAGLTTSFRRPDFVSDTLIVESKNVQTLDEDDRDLLGQIGDYALIALTLHRPLWLYTRVNTTIDPKYFQVVEATGGGIVRYFTVPTFSDSADDFSKAGLALSGLCIVVLITGEVVLRRPRRALNVPVRRTNPPTRATAEATPRPTPRTPDPVGDALDAMRLAEDAVQRTRDDLDKLQ